MYCKNCGNEVSENAAVCVKCGAKIGTGNSYCQNCGHDTDPNADVCTNCGFAIKKQKSTNFSGTSGEKARITAGLLGIFLGGFGVHNFYLGKTTIGIIQIIVTLITCGAGALWGVIEGILILTGYINTDVNGNTLI